MLFELSDFQFDPKIPYTGVNPFWTAEARSTVDADVSSFHWPARGGRFGEFTQLSPNSADNRSLETPMGGSIVASLSWISIAGMEIAGHSASETSSTFATLTTALKKGCDAEKQVSSA